jgi:hypothetical protein
VWHIDSRIDRATALRVVREFCVARGPRLPAIALAKAGPLYRKKSIRYQRLGFLRLIDAHRHDERPPFRDQQRTLLREMPLQPEIALRPRLRVRRDHRYEQRARLDLLPDLPVPLVASAQLIQVEPHFHAGRP